MTVFVTRAELRRGVWVAVLLAPLAVAGGAGLARLYDATLLGPAPPRVADYTSATSAPVASTPTPTARVAAPIPDAGAAHHPGTHGAPSSPTMPAAAGPTVAAGPPPAPAHLGAPVPTAVTTPTPSAAPSTSAPPSPSAPPSAAPTPEAAATDPTS